MRRDRSSRNLKRVRRFGPAIYMRSYNGDLILQVRLPGRWHFDLRHRV